MGAREGEVLSGVVGFICAIMLTEMTEMARCICSDVTVRVCAEREESKGDVWCEGASVWAMFAEEARGARKVCAGRFLETQEVGKLRMRERSYQFRFEGSGHSRFH